MASTPQLPSELFRVVAEFCSTPELLSLVLIDKSIYRDTIGCLYKITEVNSPRQLRRFEATITASKPSFQGQPKLASLPHKLSFVLVEPCKDSLLSRLEGSMVKILLAVGNLKDLTFRLSESFTFHNARLADVTFKLTALYVCPGLGPGLGSFIPGQNEIRFLTMSDDPDLWASNGSVMPMIPGTVLPQLKSLCASTPHTLKLVPGRPIISVSVQKLRANQIQSAASLISGSTAPLMFLVVSLLVDDQSECGSSLTRLLDMLSFCHETLRMLTIVFRATATLHQKCFSHRKVCVTIDTTELEALLPKFAVLCQLELDDATSPASPLLYHTHPLELMECDFWKQLNCHSLERVVVFGRKLTVTSFD